MNTVRTYGSQAPESYTKVNAEQRVMLHLESLFLFSLVWSVGGSCADNAARHAFDDFVRAAVGEQLPGYTSPSGEQYTLPEDIPEGHVRLKVSQCRFVTWPCGYIIRAGAPRVVLFTRFTLSAVWARPGALKGV